MKKQLKEELSSNVSCKSKKKETKSSESNQHHSSKSKATAKQGGGKLQWDIMRSLGLDDDLIVKFTDCNFWLEYFPEICKSNLKSIGAGIDWRRSFYTTEANKYYDQFVKWQFIRLKEKNKLEYGKRYSIYSPSDKQPCMDHDRASGETVLPLEYTLIKLELLQEYPKVINNFISKMKNNEEEGEDNKIKKYGKNCKIYFVAATLRPETMYGQVNCWISPKGQYGLFEINENELFICTERCANNLAYQNYSITPFQLSKSLLTIHGSELIGAKLKAPLSQYEFIYALPMNSISMKKGSGIVTSVPSDSPDDYQNFMELKNYPIWREKLSVKDEWILPYSIIPVIETEKGNITAEYICNELNIQSSNDYDKLKQAKELTYKLGYYDGKMLLGEYKNEKVIQVKDKIKEFLLINNLAIKYAEPESEVISRSGDICVVALTDQWFIQYSDNQWKDLVRKALGKLNTFGDETRNTYEHTLEWLKQWACSRNYGLGTRLPWDEEYLIESLSDSTIYMAYYTIAHLLQAGIYDGSSIGPFHITPEQLTPEVFDYIFLHTPYPSASSTSIPSEDILQKLRYEFEYWYPLDLRVSGKDLIPNHLTFSLYNHVAIWEHDESKWPKAFRGNGHLLLNNSKMSKQNGNFLTVADSIDLFGADATRIALAHAGDGISDANFECSNANKAVLDLYNSYNWAKDMLTNNNDNTNHNNDQQQQQQQQQLDNSRDNNYSFEDKIFDCAINKIIQQTDNAYSKLHFREALLFAFYELKTARDNYRSLISPTNKMNGKLIRKFIEVQALLMAPITPHWSELLWELLGNHSFIVHASFPVPGPIDEMLLDQQEYILRIRDEFLKKVSSQKKRNAKLSIEKGTVYFANRFPQWHENLLSILVEHCDDHENCCSIDVDKITKILKNHEIIKKNMNLAIPLLKELQVVFFTLFFFLIYLNF
jgi:leucyl-tRNA synthetase